MNPGRKMPEGFADVANDMTATDLAKHFDAGLYQVRRWLNNLGIQKGTPQGQGMPDGFVEAAGKMGVKALRLHYKCGDTSLYRWFKEAGIEAPDRRKTEPAPPPEGFAKVGHMSLLTLAKQYGVSDHTVRRWRKEAGIVAAAPVRLPKTEIPADWYEWAPRCTNSELSLRYGIAENTIKRMIARTNIKRLKKVFSSGPKQALPVQLDPSVAGQAQRHLQKWMRVVRASTLKKGEKGWVVGREHMSEMEMLDFAKRKGWRQDAWKDLAA
jgi:hypothetical protein